MHATGTATTSCSRNWRRRMPPTPGLCLLDPAGLRPNHADRGSRRSRVALQGSPPNSSARIQQELTTTYPRLVTVRGRNTGRNRSLGLGSLLVTGALVGWVEEQIAASGLDSELGELIGAALAGDGALDALLDHGTLPESTAADKGPATTAGGAFLTSIDVEGFRGIGEAARLTVAPHPGLTVVAGRNGSGKSSLAEALELVLTGDTYRWAAKSSIQWGDRWRNLHHGHARIEVGVVEHGREPVLITTSWPDDATDSAARTTKVERIVDGTPQEVGDSLAALGWAAPMEQYRPMLSYDELGNLLESGQSKLYDALASILGVEQLTDALTRIKSRLKARRAPLAAAITRRKSLQGEVTGIDDQRATDASTLLRKSVPDTTTLRALATGTGTTPSGPLISLRALTSVVYPQSAQDISALAARIRSAVAGLAAVADDAASLSQRELARLNLLEQALAVHEEHGEMPCPVCRRGTLDDDWAITSQDLATALRRQSAAYGRARQTLDIARRDLSKALLPRPGALTSVSTPNVETAVTAVRSAWESFLAIPQGDDHETLLNAAKHIEQHIEPLLDALTALHESAAAEIDRLNDVWQPMASQIAAWCDEWDAANQDKLVVDRLAAAEKWLKENDLRLKNERLQPITDGARHAWSKLRQESNIEIGNLELAGSATRRRVHIDTSIDGTQAGGIPVLSQGELHALALALFIPRATMPDSPFRFVVLDDPIQAMDPAKVDGFVELLGEIAATHQIIVLSHDDRLPAAVRRSSVDATILEVNRGQRSRVTLRTHTDPAMRYLADAFGMISAWKNNGLAEPALRRTLPGMLRFALEAAAKDRYFTRVVTNGTDLSDAEAAWGKAETTRKKVSLAVFGENRPDVDLAGWVGGSHHRKYGLINVGVAMHQGLNTNIDPTQAAKTVEQLIKDVRAAQ